MRRISALAMMALAGACLMLAGACLMNAQGRPVDWASYAGDAQRSGWEKSDSRITKDNVKDFKLVLKRKLEDQKGVRVLTPPVVIGMLISYRGFKELAFVESSNGNLWSIDSDMDRIFWQKQLGAGKAHGASGACANGLVATPSLTPPMVFRPRPAGKAAPAVNTPPPSSAARAAALGGGGFGTPRPIFAVTSDGKLHLLNTSNGDEYETPVTFLPAGAKASGLTVFQGAVYTSTSGACGGAPNAVWAIDLASPASTVASYPVTNANVSGIALGTDGTVYAQTSAGALLALTGKDLKLKNSFTVPEGARAAKSAAASNVPTPVVFTYKDRDLIVSAGRDGRLYLLDSAASTAASDNNKAPLYQTQPVSTDAAGGVWGGLSSWQDADGTRWVLAPVWGAVNPELKLPGTNGPAPGGSIVAFKVEEQSGLPVLTPAWVSREMNSPQPPVITSGLVFALSSGVKAAGHATLYALDAETGKELYSTGNEVTAPANLTGMTLVNGRVYFTTTDGTLWAFGVYLER